MNNVKILGSRLNTLLESTYLLPESRQHLFKAICKDVKEHIFDMHTDDLIRAQDTHAICSLIDCASESDQQLQAERYIKHATLFYKDLFGVECLSEARYKNKRIEDAMKTILEVKKELQTVESASPDVACSIAQCLHDIEAFMNKTAEERAEWNDIWLGTQIGKMSRREQSETRSVVSAARR